MTALAHQPTKTWFDQAAAHPKTQVRMRALVAAKLRRELPPSTNVYAVVKKLAGSRTLNREDHLDLLRVFGIFREHMQKSTTVQKFLAEQYPAQDPDVAFEQAYLMGYYGVTNGFSKLLQALESEPDHVRQFHIAQALAKLPGGWTEAEEQQLVTWFVKQQTGWFAEFKAKGVEFPEFWSAVIFDFARHHTPALFNVSSKIQLTSLLGGVYLDLLASQPNGLASLIELHDQPTQKPEVRSRIARRLAQEKPSSARHTDIVFTAFKESTDRELLRASTGFFTRNIPQAGIEPVAERAIALLERERSLFKPVNDLLAAVAQTKSAPGNGLDRVEPPLREQNLAFWKSWFNDRFKREVAQSIVEGKEQADADLFLLIFSNQLTNGNAARGGQIYERLQCHTCHSGGVNPGREGRIFGPDLAGVARRLNRQELADSLVYPSKQVPDRFKAFELTLKDSTTLTGFITEQNTNMVTFVERDQVRQIPRANIASLTPQKSSLMPEKLMNRLTREELADLMAFLEK
jgi:putative heme-binding domain-containing protein